MSVERDGDHYHGTVTFACDGCGEVAETGLIDFSAALNTIKREGWIARNERLGWAHYCKDCKHEPA